MTSQSFSLNDTSFSPLSDQDTNKSIASRTGNDRVCLIPLRVDDAFAVESLHGMISVVALTLSGDAPIFLPYSANNASDSSKLPPLTNEKSHKYQGTSGEFPSSRQIKGVSLANEGELIV